MVPVLWFLLVGSIVNSLLLAWQLQTSRFENTDLRAQNERLIARIAQSYHFATGRPSDSLPEVPLPPSPRPFFSFRPKPPIRRTHEEQ